MMPIFVKAAIFIRGLVFMEEGRIGYL